MLLVCLDFAYISSILSKAVKWGFIPFNPAVNAELPKMETKEAAHLDEADARKLLQLLQTEPIKYRAAITFDLLSGLRRGELLGLRWSDVDFENETITIVQTSSYAKGKGIYTDTPKNKTSSRPLKLSPCTPFRVFVFVFICIYNYIYFYIYIGFFWVSFGFSKT